MSYTYDDQNVFAKILRGEIPNDTVLETEHTLAFRDIQPQMPVHVLVIPKGPYVCFDHFTKQATDAEILDFSRAIAAVCEQESVSLDQSTGYRLISNTGPDGHQEVPHLHVHVLGGGSAGRMLSRSV